MNQYGSLQMVPEWELVRCMDKVRAGTHVNQQDFYQRNSWAHSTITYHTHKHETLAVLEALMKWEDKLLRRKFMVVTDHKGLEYFKTQPNLLPRQTRWWEYLSPFNYNTIHVDGTRNQVADSLSHYYEYNTIEDEYPNSELVKADEILEQDLDLAPIQQFIEIWNNAIRRLQRLQERTPTARLECQMLNETFNNIPVEQDVRCIYAPDKVNPNIFQFYFDFSDIFHHTSMPPLFATSMNFIWFLSILFHLLLSTKITSTWGDTFFLFLFGTRFANTFPCVVPGVEIRAMYGIIVSHALEQGICMLNCTIPTSPPQCLTVTEGWAFFYLSIIILLIKM